MAAYHFYYTTRKPLGVALSLSYLHDDIFLKNSKEFID
ncbi:hypothetical protein BN863_15980 [Formosa agariphila KMM 3901]|uniref:Uncharacterized protein n=1 Tax=Formosa agariphila (strain DSM 15362 / KCTC 12365 / LMG 23005 / KMM 3901 / M-2Alg 35-1) TaxID=1347342 RepID=T2KKP8_FORAG|nr:hypothetical protein BN863_15980 [Formosa agariphila KMM 3901]